MDDFNMDKEFDSDIDLTPLIDVVFLLIIFFVLATTFSKPVLDVVLPNSKAAGKVKSDKEDLIVEIDKDGRIMCENNEYTKETINDLLHLRPERRMNLHIDKAAPFESFIQIIDRAKLINRKNIVVTTEKNDS